MAETNWGPPPAYGGNAAGGQGHAPGSADAQAGQVTQATMETAPGRGATGGGAMGGAPGAMPASGYGGYGYGGYEGGFAPAYGAGAPGVRGAPPPHGPDPEAPPEPPEAAGGGVLNIFAAGLSLVLLAGLGVWGYRLAVRDVTGVPVVRALEGPMRVQPEGPGGEEVAYQGYSVNAVQGQGGVAPPPDRLALAPPNAGLAPEDLAAPPGASVSALAVDGRGEEAAGAHTDGVASGSVAAAQPVPRPADMADMAETDARSEALALAEEIAAGSEPLSDVTATSAPAGEATLRAADRIVAEVVNAPQVIPASIPGVARSPRPAARPADLAVQVAALRTGEGALASAAPASEAVEIAAASLPPGTQLVQLGAFDSPEVARAEWDRLAERFADYFVGKQRLVVEASQSGRRFWRLRAAGFADRADARRFCVVLKAARAPCIPVVTR